MNTKRCVLITALFICSVFIGCRAPDDMQIKTEELSKARKLWLAKKIVNYNMTVRYEPHGDPSASPVLIKVRNNQTVSIKPVSKNDNRSLAHYQSFETVEKMFDSIQEELDNKSKVKCSFNSDFGYPAEVYVRFAQSSGYYQLYVDKIEFENIE